MAVKQIQLRGISRTPSDRMTRDGGLAESLNMQLDGEELAPMRLPADVTEELLDGYPALSSGERIVFIHNGNGYKNYIAELQDTIYAYIKGRESTQTLAQDESIKDIQSLGNALVISYESGAVEYFLFDTDHYVSFADGVTDLGWEFTVIGAQGSYLYQTSFTPSDPGTSNLREVWNYADNVNIWHNRFVAPEEGMSANQKAQLALIREYQENFWAMFDRLREYNRERGFFSVPVLARYAVRLYDGSYGFISPPVLLGGARSDSAHKKVFWVTPPSQSGAHMFYGRIQYPYEAALSFRSAIPANWKDLIASVDIFLSEDINYPLYGGNLVDATETALVFEGEQAEKASQAAKSAFLAASNFYRIASLSLEDIAAGSFYNLLAEPETGKNDYRVVQPRLEETTRTGVIPNSMMIYNGRILSLGDSYVLRSGYRWMFGPAYYWPSAGKNENYKVRFFIKKDGKEYAVDALPGAATIGSNSDTHGWGAIFFPDPNCYKAELIYDTSRYTIKMEEHPNLNCSYGWLGFGENLVDLTPETASDFSGDGPSLVDEPRKLSMTRTDSILSYELGNTQTFDEPIIGAATIAKALLTSPYGLADIYVFTEGGIYTIGLMKDGSFGDIHPLTRDVAIPETIMMIDHGIVFTTDKSVMLLRENGIQDISQVMQGKHDPLDNSVATLLSADVNYAGLVPAATDTAPFMAFAKGARAAYDYAGNRLIFFNDAYAHQYVFMLNTMTWHKTNLTPSLWYSILNSHPRCIVNCGIDATAIHKYLKIISVEDYDPEGGGEENLESVCSDIEYWLGIPSGPLYDDIVENGFPYEIDVTDYPEIDIEELTESLDAHDVCVYEYVNRPVVSAQSSLMDFSTVLDDSDYLYDNLHPVKGIIVTRPLSFDAPDIRKVLKDLRIRTQANRNDVKYILLASMDGKTWQRLSSRGGGSFKWFKIVLVTSLAPVERIGWLDVDVETRYTDKLR